MKNRILSQEVEREVVSSTRTMSAVAPGEETTPENASSRLKSSCSFFLCCGQEDWLKKGEFIVWNIYKTEKVTRSMLLIFHSIITNTSEKEQVKAAAFCYIPGDKNWYTWRSVLGEIGKGLLLPFGGAEASPRTSVFP